MLHLSTFCFLFYPLVWLCNFCSFDGRQMWSRKKPLLLTQDWLCYCLFLVSFWHSWLGTTSFTTTLRRPFPQRRRSPSPRRRWRGRDWSREFLRRESRGLGLGFCSHYLTAGSQIFLFSGTKECSSLSGPPFLFQFSFSPFVAGVTLGSFKLKFP